MTISNKLKKRFCKDIGVNIGVLDEPYFTERIYLYDSQYGTIDKWDRFLGMIYDFGNEQVYNAHYNKVKDDFITHIKSKEEYQDFISFDMHTINNNHHNINSKTIYKQENVGKLLVSVDMKRGNYTCMKKYSPELVSNTRTYEDLICNFTYEEHIINSKYIRQVVFGNLNPKRQVSYQKFMMTEVLEKMGDYTCIFYSNDELVFEIDIDDIIKIPLILKDVSFEIKTEFF